METHTFEELILKTGVYEQIKIDNETNLELLRFLRNSYLINIDMHCIYCEKESTFQMENKPFSSTIDRESWSQIDIGKYLNESLKDLDTFVYFLECSRNALHKYSFIFKGSKEGFMKIGQFPSVAALEKNDIIKYKKLLKKDYENLNKAIGLRSHGIGAGSYVYLRRIFENLIEEKHLEARSEPTWDDEKYNSSRMKEKIKLLEFKLPTILVEMPELYGILSKGIHELSEEECLEYFPITKAAIELILDEKLVMLEKEAKRKELKSSLGAIAATISK